MHSTIAIHLFPGLRVATLLLALFSTAWGGQAPVYRVLSDGRAPSYLVGTMHSEDPRVLAVLTPLVPLIDSVDTVVIEMIPDAVTMLAVAAATLLPGGSAIFTSATSLAKCRITGKPLSMKEILIWFALFGY